MPRTAHVHIRSRARVQTSARAMRRASRWISSLRETPAILRAWWAGTDCDRQIRQACLAILLPIAAVLAVADLTAGIALLGGWMPA